MLGRICVVAVVFASACLLHEKTYSLPKGNLQVVLTNFSRSDLCVIDFVPDQSGMLPWNPLAVEGDASAPPRHIRHRENLQVGLAPGMYDVEASTCDHQFTGSVHVAVQGPMAIAVGGLSQQPAPAPAGYQSFALNMRHFNPAAGGAPEPAGGGEAEQGGGEATAPAGPSCSPDGTNVGGDYTKCCHSFSHHNGAYYCCDPSTTQCTSD